jgi:hypothetical protein
MAGMKKMGVMKKGGKNTKKKGVVKKRMGEKTMKKNVGKGLKMRKGDMKVENFKDMMFRKFGGKL